MPIVQASLLIRAPQQALFDLAQDYHLRLKWDPFLRDMRFLDGAREAAVGVRVWVRAWTRMAMVVEYVGLRRPDVVAMKMVEGPPGGGAVTSGVAGTRSPHGEIPVAGWSGRREDRGATADPRPVLVVQMQAAMLDPISDFDGAFADRLRSPAPRTWSRCVASVSILLAVVATTASAQLVSRRLEPSRANVPGRLGAVNESQPLIEALPMWHVGALTPYVNLFSGSLFVRYRAVAAPAIGYDWDLSFYYNASRASETSTLGKGWRHSYDTALLLNTPPGSITVRWGDGRRDVFTPSGPMWVGPASLEGRKITTITGGYRLATKHGDKLEFNTSGQLIRLVDRNANTTTLAYVSGRLSTITDWTGRQLVFAYNGSGQVSSITGFLAQTMTLSYSSNRLASISEASGYPFAFGYDAADRLVRITDGQSRAIHVGYYSPLAVVHWVRAPVARREFFFDQGTQTTLVRDSLTAGENTQASYTFNPNGTTATVTQSALGSATSTYDPSTLAMLTHTDPNDHVWARTVNSVGDVLTVTDPTLQTWTTTYDPTYHLRATLTTPEGALWQWLRDGNGNLTTLTDPLTKDWTWTYDFQGLAQTFTDPNLSTTTYSYDGYGNRSVVSDPMSNQEQFTYDDRGNVINWSDQLYNSWSVTRDGRDGVTQLNSPGGNYYTLEYWPAGKPKKGEDPEGGKREYAYDALDRLVRVVESVQDSSKLQRDGGGNLRGVLDGVGDGIQIVPDGAGRPTQVIDPAGEEWNYAYDGVNRLVVVPPSGDQVVETHDARHLLTKRTVDGITVEYSYDNDGRMTIAKRTDPNGLVITYEYEYDGLPRPVRKTTSPVGRTTYYSYDNGGRLTRMEDNLQPRRWEYSYDTRNLVTTVQGTTPPGPGARQQSSYDFLLSMGYTLRRQLSNLSIYPIGAGIFQAYNADFRVTSLNVSSSPFSGYCYPVFSLRGDLTSYNGYSPSAGYFNMNATYNAAHRVITEDHGSLGSFSYSHDVTGNRYWKNGPGGFESYGYGAGHRLTSAGMLTQSWNVNGDVTSVSRPGTVITMTYQPDRSLATLTRNGSTWRFIAGPFGEIAALVSPANDTTWYDTDVGPTGVLRRSTFPARNTAPTGEYGYVQPHSGSTPRFRMTPGGIEALLPGPFGVSEVVDNAGLVSSRYTSMFGEVLASSGTATSSPGFHDMDVLGDPSVPLLKGTSDQAELGGMPGGVAYLPGTGSFLHDLGLGPDFMAGIGPKFGPPLPLPPIVWPPKPAPNPDPPVPDFCDLSQGVSEDCNRNGLPDECEPIFDFDGSPWDSEEGAPPPIEDLFPPLWEPENFFLPLGKTVRKLRWWGGYDDSDEPDFNVPFFGTRPIQPGEEF